MCLKGSPRRENFRGNKCLPARSTCLGGAKSCTSWRSCLAWIDVLGLFLTLECSEEWTGRRGSRSRCKAQTGKGSGIPSFVIY